MRQRLGQLRRVQQCHVHHRRHGHRRLLLSAELERDDEGRLRGREEVERVQQPARGYGGKLVRGYGGGLVRCYGRVFGREEDKVNSICGGNRRHKQLQTNKSRPHEALSTACEAAWTYPNQNLLLIRFFVNLTKTHKFSLIIFKANPIINRTHFF